MGCYCHHPFDVLDDVYLHRGEEQLPPREHTDPEVRLIRIIFYLDLTPCPVTLSSRLASTLHQQRLLTLTKGTSAAFHCQTVYENSLRSPSRRTSDGIYHRSGNPTQLDRFSLDYLFVL